MRFFRKLFTSILILLTLAVVATEYYIVAHNMNSNMDKQVEYSLKQHQLVRFAVQSDYLSSVNTVGARYMELADIMQNTVNSMDVAVAIHNADDEELIFSNLPFDINSLDPVEGKITYRIRKANDSRFLIVMSEYSIGPNKVIMSTAANVDNVYNEADSIVRQCSWILISILGAGVLFAFAIASFVSRPVKQLTDVGNSFAQGDYTARATLFPKDEIGDLAQVFNNMADSIEEKIDQLELAVKQREDFTAAFAHELKTPMTSIIGYADTLYQKDLTVQEARDAAGFILNEGMRLEALSFKLLELITLNNDNFMLEEIRMTDFFKDIEDTLCPVAKKRGIRLRIEIDEAYCRIEYDLFKTMILNLADNAMKSGTDEVAILAHNFKDEYLIAIVDRGRGIPQEELKRVTEAFYMVDKARSRKEHGAGLGLALCSKIAAIHSANLDIRSREGAGTAIRLKLQVVPDQDDGSDSGDGNGGNGEDGDAYLGGER